MLKVFKYLCINTYGIQSEKSNKVEKYFSIFYFYVMRGTYGKYSVCSVTSETLVRNLAELGKLKPAETKRNT